MVTDDRGNHHNNVGTGAASFWNRPTNSYAGCSCPPWRYNPRFPHPTNPDCELHGETRTA
jgi:hypothetical protein